MSAHDHIEHAEHAEHASHGGNKKIALLISVLALFLAFSETLGKSAQSAAITDNVTANDLWAFFQAKTIRMTVLNTAAEQMQIEVDRAAFQIGIVMASAEVITEMVVLGWLSVTIGTIGLALTGIGMWAPHALHFLTH
jgi:Domain of unknown function (DUF4337)